jgi:small-conductance mechanosensitive channel
MTASLLIGHAAISLAFQPLAEQKEVQNGKDEPKPEVPPTPEKVEVQPLATDVEIAERLKRILEATGWYVDPTVRVDSGVVFLRGRAEQDAQREWAGNLASRTTDVVAVVNRIEVAEPSILDLSPAWSEMQAMGRTMIQSLPGVGLALLMILLTIFAARYVGRSVDYLGQRRIPSALLRQVASYAAMIPMVLVGIYFALRVSGLSQMALTVLGGTGIAGLIIGIAFQNIAENFLASILISLQRPFQTNDMIEVAGFQGLVHRVTARGTVLVTLEGNHIQIPNAVVYKSVIRNFTANPNSRLDFKIGVGYDNAAAEAQDVILRVLQEHPAVLKKPEPTVLIEELGPSSVSVRAYFWVNIREHDGAKTKSAVLRLVKKKLAESSISIPDTSREVIFPQGVPLRRLEREELRVPEKSAWESNRAALAAEGKLRSDDEAIKQQAAQSRPVEAGPDLLASKGTTNGTHE